MKEKKIINGLNDQEVLASRQKYGENLLTPPAKEPMWKRFITKFEDPLIIILLVAGILSIAISFYEYYGLHERTEVFFEPVGIFIAILLATGMAFFFEEKANKAFSVLNQVNDEEPVEVIRNGNTTQITKREVVVGDVVRLNTGSEVPADGTLLQAISLNIDESSLTGEPICHKSTHEADFDKDATFPTNYVLRGTKVMEGHGLFRVEKIGDNTENGKVFVASQIDNSVKTPLTEQLERLGKLITWASYTIAALILIARIIMFFSNFSFEWVRFLQYLLDSIMICVTLIVVAVPEGLPMAVTLSLAYSMRRMLKTNNLVRKMHACETMGATTVICTDKTGTLTQNQMRVSEMAIDRETEEHKALAREAIAVNSTASLDFTEVHHPTALGNPTEGALLLWLNDQGYDYRQLRTEAEVIDELPFSTERKCMGTLVRSAQLPGKTILYIKGATDIIRNYCSSIMGDRSWDEISNQLLTWQNQAMRTLGFACMLIDDDNLHEGVIPNLLDTIKQTGKGLTFQGIVAISDPVRKEVPAAVRECLDAGIDVKIVTGDTPGTAKEIGRQVGLWTEKDCDNCVITGPEFEALSDEELSKRVNNLKIIARARPMDKKRLVEALQAQHQVVAVTGDGTNDAPALKAAHVGLSMGDGTNVAKEASDITIIDNSFRSIGRAVMWGRSLYQNIQRFILFQMTVNVAACLIVLAGALMGTQSPLTVTQMLWVNLIMDTFAAMALASLPPSESVMHDKPRNRKSFIINPAMTRLIIGVGCLFFVILLTLLYMLEHAPIHSMTDFLTWKNMGNQGLTDHELSIFFTLFVMIQFWNMFNARAFATGRSAFHLKGCKGFGGIALLIFVGQIIIVQCGGRMFNVTPLSLSDWLIIVTSTSAVLWIGELFRLFNKRNKQ